MEIVMGIMFFSLFIIVLIFFSNYQDSLFLFIMILILGVVTFSYFNLIIDKYNEEYTLNKVDKKIEKIEKIKRNKEETIRSTFKNIANDDSYDVKFDIIKDKKNNKKIYVLYRKVFYENLINKLNLKNIKTACKNVEETNFLKSEKIVKTIKNNKSIDKCHKKLKYYYGAIYFDINR